MQRKDFVRVLNERVPLKDLTVLELGCGDGVFTRELAKVAKYVLAVDARREHLDKVAELSLENVFTMMRDVERLMPPDKHDVTFHVGLLYHLWQPMEHLIKVMDCTRTAIFLDTHYSPHGPVKRQEHPGSPREGTNPTSVWYPLDMIIEQLRTRFRNVELLDDRLERNGRRATILARRD